MRLSASLVFVLAFTLVAEAQAGSQPVPAALLAEVKAKLDRLERQEKGSPDYESTRQLYRTLLRQYEEAQISEAIKRLQATQAPRAVVPPECRWGKAWPAYDPGICGEPSGEQRRAERVQQRSDFYSTSDAEYCVISPVTESIPVCVFKDLDSCKRASRDELWRKAYPNAEWCKPRE